MHTDRNYIFGFAAAALADGRCPVYVEELHPTEKIIAAYRSIFHGSDIEQNWVKVLQEKVFQMSWGKYEAESIANLDEWPGLRVKGPVHYMKLIETCSKKAVLYFQIGPYKVPIKPAQVTLETLIRAK